MMIFQIQFWFWFLIEIENILLSIKCMWIFVVCPINALMTSIAKGTLLSLAIIKLHWLSWITRIVLFECRPLEMLYMIWFWFLQINQLKASWQVTHHCNLCILIIMSNQKSTSQPQHNSNCLLVMSVILIY